MTETTKRKPREGTRWGKTGGKHLPKSKGYGPAFCGQCGHHTAVVDTRHCSGYLRRRRECQNTKGKVGRFTTIELEAPNARQNKSALTAVMEKLQEGALKDLIGKLQGLNK